MTMPPFSLDWKDPQLDHRYGSLQRSRVSTGWPKMVAARKKALGIRSGGLFHCALLRRQSAAEFLGTSRTSYLFGWLMG
jgi:hypothetical protein